MNVRRFALSFLVTTMLAAPLVLTAEGSDDPVLEVAPRFDDKATVANLQLRSTVEKSTPTSLRIRLTGRNTSDKPVNTEVEVVARRDAKSSEMARMAPAPETVAQQTVALSVTPGEAFDRVVVIDKLKLGSKRSLKKRPVYASVFGSKTEAQASLANRFPGMMRR